MHFSWMCQTNERYAKRGSGVSSKFRPSPQQTKKSNFNIRFSLPVITRQLFFSISARLSPCFQVWATIATTRLQPHKILFPLLWILLSLSQLSVRALPKTYDVSIPQFYDSSCSYVGYVLTRHYVVKFVPSIPGLHRITTK